MHMHICISFEIGYLTGKWSSLIRLGWESRKLEESLVLYPQCLQNKHTPPFLVVIYIPEIRFSIRICVA